MKKVFLAFALLLATLTVQAQDVFSKGSNNVNVGIGLGGNYFPIEASYEHCIKDNLIKGENGSIGIGGYFAWYGDSEKYGGVKWNYNHFVFGVRGAFHYQFVEKLDTYAGLMVGYNVASSSYDGETSVSGSADNVFLPGLYAGARYYFSPNVAVYSELGYGAAYLSAGISFHF
ncbi:hypothetical protein M2480_002015 [Parabacteroides sp. PFB2-12]|uniref:hypothetical protein n=1 Tax=unclassified Parabacteroides TaxID=2649774 RepID=UPI002476171C|nr:MULTISPECIES: hypothetical protein [unclassified Parabacteroides]MDH6342959.1 hypothetical protein [Parabacteroides sp. PM6-13]MDH6391026.1 hypothetical protein [Parabacteroides sp. PFB2-12]